MLKQIGAIFLILGTSVAAAMLGLPVVTAQENYMLTALQIFLAWMVMTAGAWSITQVNLMMPAGANLISMSEATLGKNVKWLTWFIYMLLLYCLISAYIAASSDILQALLGQVGLLISRGVAILAATGLLSAVIYRGIRLVDLINRGLLSVKLVICFIIIAATLPHFHGDYVAGGLQQFNGSSFLVMLTAFGYAIIIPSLREYLEDDPKALRRVVLIGSTLPVFLYLLWVAVIQGAIPRGGETGLLAMQQSSNVNSMLMMNLVHITQYPLLKMISIVFISISSITGLLGVSLCAVDFLADGLAVEKQGAKRVGLILIAVMPPMLTVLLKPALFISALAYAGLCCLYILVALPIAMYVRRGRLGAP